MVTPSQMMVGMKGSIAAPMVPPNKTPKGYQFIGMTTNPASRLATSMAYSPIGKQTTHLGNPALQISGGAQIGGKQSVPRQ